MLRQQMEKKENMIQHDKPSKSLSDAMEDCLDRAIMRLDKMFLLVCEARAAYINSRTNYRKEDFASSYNDRLFANNKLEQILYLVKNGTNVKED